MKSKHLVKRMTKRMLLILLAVIFLFPLPNICVEALTIDPSDYYYIASAIDTNQVVDVSGGSHHNGANIQLYKKNGTDAQLFKIVRSSEDGYYNIINKGSEKALDVEGGGTESGTNVQLYEQNGTQAQQWQLFLKNESCENIYIVARCGKFLDACGGESKNGTNIWIYDGNYTLAQEFILIPYINTTYETVTIEFSDLDSWKEEMMNMYCRLSLGGNYAVNPSGNTYYTGKIVTDMNVLSWKTINIKVPLSGPGNPYKWEEISLPCEIQYKLHTHNNEVKMWFNVSSFVFYQQCECGYRDEWRCDVPWPDLTPNTDTQTTDSVIRAIKPQHKVLYNVQ